jgi:PAS domain S-box-containing protein
MNPAVCVPEAGFENFLRRLMQDAPTLQALDAGEVDAIIDPASGRAILLPQAHDILRHGEVYWRSLVELSSEGSWELDEHHRFVAHSGAAIGEAGTDAAGLVGKALWELAFDNMSDADWRQCRIQMDWRSSIRDLELSWVDRSGEVRWISISGGPAFDDEDQFLGYRGLTRDLTERKRGQALVLAWNQRVEPHPE